MLRAKIAVKGLKVQDVGYKLFLLSRARKLKGIETYNLESDPAVLVEGGEDAVNEFVSMVKAERPPIAEISQVAVEGYEGHVMDKSEFSFQLCLEQLAKIATACVEIKEDIKEIKTDIKEMKRDIREVRDEETGIRLDFRSYVDERLRKLERMQK